MRHFFCLLITLFVGININAQKTVRMDAVKGNDFGVAYTLPKTMLQVTIDYSKITRTAGEYYMYSERYLNIANPIKENSVEYILDKLDATTIGAPDKRKSYLVEFRSNSAAAYLTLTQDGLICAINDNYTFPKQEVVIPSLPKKSTELNVHQYLSEEILRAGSTAKQAELIAKQIYRLRETRNDILTGEADNMPPDGDAYKLVMGQIDEQEQALTSLFIGTESMESMKKVAAVEPSDKEIVEKVILRFSQKLGVVEANDLAGEAIFLTLKPITPRTPLLLTVKEANERDKKFSKGIIYNIPGKAVLQLEYKNKIHVDKDCDVVQFGEQDVLDQKQFGDKNSPLKVVFYPELGAIKQTGIATR